MAVGLNKVTELVKLNLKKDGFALLDGYLFNSHEIISIKNKIYELVCIKAKQHKIKIPNKSLIREISPSCL